MAWWWIWNGDDDGRVVTQVPAREKNDPMVGKLFYDPGDYVPGKRRRPNDMKRGEFKVLCRQPGGGGEPATYWCERVTNTFGSKPEIESFDLGYVRGLVDSYDNE